MPRTHQLPRGVAMHEVLKVGPVLRLEEWGEWCKRTMVLTRGAVQFCSAFEGRLVHRHKHAIALCDRVAKADEQDLAAHAERTRPQGEFLLPEVEQEHMLLIHSLSGDHSLVAAADDEDREDWLAWLGALLRAGEAERDIGAMRACAARHGAERAAAEAAVAEAAAGAAAAVDAEEMQRGAELDAMERHAHEVEEEKARQHEQGAVQKALARARRDFEVQLERQTGAAAQEAADLGDAAVRRERAARDALEAQLAQEVAAHAAVAAELATLREGQARYGAAQARAAAEELAAAQAELARAQSELQAHKQQLADAKARAVELEEEVLTTKEEAFNLIQELHGKGSQAGSQAGSRPSSAASQSQSQRRD
jgi:hypothetical protein